MNDRARDSSSGLTPETAGGSGLVGADSPERAGRIRRDKEEDLSLIGKEIAGKYRVLRVLGQGGFGSVFLVEMLSGIVGEKLAMKVLPQAFSADPELRDQFLNEIRVAMKMVTKYIVQIRDVGVTEDGLLYYTMDYVDGKPLSALLRQEGKLPVSRALRIVMRVLKALNTAHGAGIVHRDLKPANIMVQEEAGDATKVLDFGIATAIKSEPARQKGFAGSPHYMPPEQFLGTELGFYTDVYSAGVILYECLTGERPHQGATPQEIYASLKRGPPRPVDELRPEVREHPGLAEAVHKALERNPEKRFPSARAFHERLAMVLRGEAPAEEAEKTEEAAASEAPAVGVSGRARARRIGSRRKATRSSPLGALAAILLLTGIVLAAVFLARGLQEPEKEKPGPAVAQSGGEGAEPPAGSGDGGGNPGENGTGAEEGSAPASDPVTEPAIVPPPDGGDGGEAEPGEADATRRRSLEHHLEAARRAVAAKDWSAVFRHACEKALDVDPEHKEALFLCARSLHELGRPEQLEEAIEALEDLRRIDPGWREVETILLLADCLLEQPAVDYTKVAELLEEAREVAPGSVEVVKRLVNVYPHVNPNDELIALLEDARSRGLLERSEKLDSLYREIIEEPRKKRQEELRRFLAGARKAYSKKEWTGAIAMAEEAVRRDPSSACAWFILAGARSKTGDLDRADRAAEELAARQAEREATARERCGEVIPSGSLARWALFFSGRNAYLRHTEKDGDRKHLDDARDRLADALAGIDARETPELFALARTYRGCVLAHAVPDPEVALAEVRKEFFPVRHVEYPEVVWQQSEAYFTVAKRLPVEPYETWQAREDKIKDLKDSRRAIVRELGKRSVREDPKTRSRLRKEIKSVNKELETLHDEKRAHDAIRDVQSSAFDLAVKRINDLLRVADEENNEIQRRGNVFLGRVYLAWGRSSGIPNHLVSAANRFYAAINAGEESPEVFELWAESYSLRGMHSEARRALEHGLERFPENDRLESKLDELRR